LSRLFWLIAILGVGGGVAVLIASLYASVERKSRDLAMLRLIGLSRMDLFAFPVYEGVMIAAGGLIASLLSYALLSTIINRVFADQMVEGEKICSLPWSYLFSAIAITLAVAMLSALFAAGKATRIDPADAIRSE
jgi:putative ABC transport system permease protein